MSDNIIIPAQGTGDTTPTVATDQGVGGEHYQLVKLVDGTANSTTVINSGNGVAAGALRVSVASDSTGVIDVTSRALRDCGKIDIAGFDVELPAGTQNIGDVDAIQSGTWNITNVSGTISLPTGASTLAEQQSQTTHLATIAGDTTDIETAVELIDDTVATLGTTTYTEAATKGLIIGAIRRDADTTLVDTTNEVSPLQVDAAGRLKVEAFSGETLPVSLTSTTVTGTVAVTQSGTWDEVGINDSGNSITVDWAGVAPPIGAGTEAAALRVTVATDSTGVLSVDDNGSSLTVDNGGTFAVQESGAALTALQLIDDAVFTAGTDTYAEATSKGQLLLGVRRDADTTLVNTTNEMAPLQVDANGYLKVEIFDGGGSHTVDNAGTFATQATLQTGDNTVGRVKISDGTDVADVLDLTNSNPLTVAIVDGTGDQITSFGGGTQYTEGDTDASVTGTAVMWEDAADTLRVASAAKPLPVNVVAGGAAGGTSANDDSAFTIGSQAGTPIMGLWDDTGTDSVDENDVGVVRMSANRNLFTTLRDAAGNERGANVSAGNALLVDASATTQPISAASLPLPTGASTLAEQQTQTTHLATIAGDTTDIETAVELIDDTVAVLGTTTYTEAATKGLIVGAIRRDADTTLVDTTNEVGPLQMDAAGRLKVEAFSGETLPVSLTSTTVTGTVAVTQSGTWDEVGINDSGNNISVDWAGTVPPIGAGTEAAALRVTVATDSTGVLSVDDNGGALTVDNGGTFAVQATAVGTVADDGITPGAPQMIGGQAKNFDGTAPGNVSAEDDVAIAIFDRNRRQYVNTIHPEFFVYHENSSSTVTDASVAAAPGANEANFVTDIVFSSGAATAINLFIEEGATTVLGPYYLEAIAGRGLSVHFNTPHRCTTNTAITVSTTAAIAHSIEITGFVARVD